MLKVDFWMEIKTEISKSHQFTNSPKWVRRRTLGKTPSCNDFGTKIGYPGPTCTGDDYDGCTRYARAGGIKHTLPSPHSLAHAGWLSHLYAAHPGWPPRGFPARLLLLAYGLPKWMLTHTRQCACP